MSFVSFKYAKALKQHTCWKDLTAVKFGQIWYYPTEDGESGVPFVITGAERKEEVEEILRDAIWAPTAEDILETMPSAVVHRIYNSGYRIVWNPLEDRIPYKVLSRNLNSEKFNLADDVARLYLTVRK